MEHLNRGRGRGGWYEAGVGGGKKKANPTRQSASSSSPRWLDDRKKEAGREKIVGGACIKKVGFEGSYDVKQVNVLRTSRILYRVQVKRKAKPQWPDHVQ